MPQPRERYRSKFNRRSNRSKAQDLARQARITVSASDRSKRATRLLARWERSPNQLDIRGIDTRRRGKRMTSTRRRTSRRRRETPSAVVTPPPAKRLELPAAPGRPKGTAARSVKAEVLREFRQFRPTMTPDAYGKARDMMRAVLARYSDEGPMTVTEDQRREAMATIRSHFAREMKDRYEDFGPEWGRRPASGFKSRQGRMRL